MIQLSRVDLIAQMQVFEYMTSSLDALRHGFGLVLNDDLSLSVSHRGATVIFSPTQWRCAEPLRLAPDKPIERVDARGAPLPEPVSLAKRRGRPPKDRK